MVNLKLVEYDPRTNTDCINHPGGSLPGVNETQTTSMMGDRTRFASRTDAYKGPLRLVKDDDDDEDDTSWGLPSTDWWRWDGEPPVDIGEN